VISDAALKFARFNGARVIKARTETDFLMQPYEQQPNLDESHIDAVVAAIASLTPRNRRIIEAIYFEHIPYSELAVRLKCSKPHAWRQTAAAVAALHTALLHDDDVQRRYPLIGDAS